MENCGEAPGTEGLPRYIREKDDFEMFRGSMMDVAKTLSEPRSIHNILSLEQHRLMISIMGGYAGWPLKSTSTLIARNGWPSTWKLLFENAGVIPLKIMYHHPVLCR